MRTHFSKSLSDLRVLCGQNYAFNRIRSDTMLEIKDLQATVGDKEILRGITSP